MNACPCVSGCSATRQPIAGEGVVRQRPRVVLWRTVSSRRDPCDFFCCEKLELPAPFYIEYAPGPAARIDREGDAARSEQVVWLRIY